MIGYWIWVGYGYAQLIINKTVQQVDLLIRLNYQSSQPQLQTVVSKG